jgi:hypothetical protein
MTFKLQIFLEKKYSLYLYVIPPIQYTPTSSEEGSTRPTSNNKEKIHRQYYNQDDS